MSRPGQPKTCDRTFHQLPNVPASPGARSLMTLSLGVRDVGPSAPNSPGTGKRNGKTSNGEIYVPILLCPSYSYETNWNCLLDRWLKIKWRLRFQKPLSFCCSCTFVLNYCESESHVKFDVRFLYKLLFGKSKKERSTYTCIKTEMWVSIADCWVLFQHVIFILSCRESLLFLYFLYPALHWRLPFIHELINRLVSIELL